MYLGNATDHQQVSFSSSEIHGRGDSSDNLVKRTLKEEERSLNTKSVQWRHQTMTDWTMKENNNSQYNHGKRLHEDPTWNNVNNELLDGGLASKKQKTDCSRLSVPDRSRDMNSLRGESFGSARGVGTSFAIKEEIGKGACIETEVSRNNIGSAGRFLFPFGPHPLKDLDSDVKSFLDDIRIPEPNLELALGADMKPSKQGMMLPFSVGTANLKDDHPEKAAKQDEEEDDDSASLSLSLAFPFLDKVKGTGKSVSTPQQVLPDRQHVNTSLLLFEGLSEK